MTWMRSFSLRGQHLAALSDAQRPGREAIRGIARTDDVAQPHHQRRAGKAA